MNLGLSKEYEERRGTVVCVGDSNTYGFDPANPWGGRYKEEEIWTGIVAQKSGVCVLNHGVCGREVPHNTPYTEFLCSLVEGWAKEVPPVRLWVMLGTNDLLLNGHFRAETVAERMDRFLVRLLKEEAVRSGQVRVRLIAPARIREGSFVSSPFTCRESGRLGETYRAVAEKRGIFFTDAGAWEIPVAFDGVHFSVQGHKNFAINICREVFGMELSDT